MAKLTVVPTPVGNLEDMTFRAIRVLKEADLILAEDTRTTGILLKHFEIQNKMQSHHKFNEHKTVEQIAARIKGGENIALVSDAGTPAISDPGFMLVRECVRQGVDVECLPGAATRKTPMNSGSSASRCARPSPRSASGRSAFWPCAFSTAGPRWRSPPRSASRRRRSPG